MTSEFVCRMGTLARPRMSGESAQPTISLETSNRSQKLLITSIVLGCNFGGAMEIDGINQKLVSVGISEVS